MLTCHFTTHYCDIIIVAVCPRCHNYLPLPDKQMVIFYYCPQCKEIILPYDGKLKWKPIPQDLLDWTPHNPFTTPK